MPTEPNAQRRGQSAPRNASAEALRLGVGSDRAAPRHHAEARRRRGGIPFRMPCRPQGDGLIDALTSAASGDLTVLADDWAAASDKVAVAATGTDGRPREEQVTEPVQPLLARSGCRSA